MDEFQLGERSSLFPDYFSLVQFSTEQEIHMLALPLQNQQDRLQIQNKMRRIKSHDKAKSLTYTGLIMCF